MQQSIRGCDDPVQASHGPQLLLTNVPSSRNSRSISRPQHRARSVAVDVLKGLTFLGELTDYDSHNAGSRANSSKPWRSNRRQPP
jgi:hypothetical protein